MEEYKRDSLHPPRERLIAFVEKRLEQAEVESIRQHLEDCEFCREFSDDYRMLHESLRAAEQEELPPEAQTLANRLYHAALAGRVIPLKILGPGADGHELPLAADGEQQAKPSPDRALTLYSEDPEIVLRIMSGPQPDDNYLQLISEDAGLVSQVLIRAPQLDREFVTDEQGRAELGSPPPVLTDDLKWQIKMPDAVFDLEPLAYDPEKTEYSRQIVLATDKQDKIEVTLEGKTEGKKLSLRIIALEGRTDIGRVTVVIDRQRSDIASGDPAVFDLVDPDRTISIRLFTK